jgi:hypothetical protein
MSWHEWMQQEQNQFVVVLAILFTWIAALFGYRQGERVGYEEGMRALYKTIIMNDPGMIQFRTREKQDER